MSWDSIDTSLGARNAQFAAWARLGPAGRVTLALRMSDDVRRLAAAGIRARHPEYNDEQARWALIRLVHGDEVFGRVWPQGPLLDP